MTTGHEVRAKALEGAWLISDTNIDEFRGLRATIQGNRVIWSDPQYPPEPIVVSSEEGVFLNDHELKDVTSTNCIWFNSVSGQTVQWQRLQLGSGWSGGVPASSAAEEEDEPPAP